MKKTILTIGIFTLFLQGCAYKPIIDTAGRSGTFNEDKANQITNDIILCEQLAEQNTNHLQSRGTGRRIHFNENRIC